MKCPICGYADSRVIDSRPTEEGAVLRRRRHCDNCGARFTTHERVQSVPLMVIKKDGRREEFNSDKLYGGIAKACNKRPVPTGDITALVGQVESDLRGEGTPEVSAERVGEIVMERLIHLDEVAYVRFASVYQRFDDVRRFAQLLERIARRARRNSKNGASTHTHHHLAASALSKADVEPGKAEPDKKNAIPQTNS